VRPPPDTSSTRSTGSIESHGGSAEARPPAGAAGGSSTGRGESHPFSGPSTDTRLSLPVPHGGSVGVITGGDGADTHPEHAASRLFRKYGDQLLRRALWKTGNVQDAEDLVQETFVRVVKLPSQQIVVREESAFLRTVLDNLIKDFYRTQGRRVQAVREPVEDDFFKPRLGWEVEEAYLDESCREIIATLPRRQQETLLLIYGLDLSPAMAAERMNISPRDCHRFHYLALKKLREYETNRGRVQ
jgi:RNA polymerase sigma factor (sigma-70 family)